MTLIARFTLSCVKVVSVSNSQDLLDRNKAVKSVVKSRNFTTKTGVFETQLTKCEKHTEKGGFPVCVQQKSVQHSYNKPCFLSKKHM